VEGITIAGNLRDMFRNVAAVGNDVLVRGSKQVGSILIEQMKVAGEWPAISRAHRGIPAREGAG
jgi:PmbA protein